VLLLVGVLFWRVPTSFVPSEDQGYLIGSIILPDAASLQRTQKTGAQLWDVLSKNENVAHAFVVPGRDFVGGANKTSAGTTFVLLKHWDERKQTAQQVAADLSKRGMGFADGMAIMFNPPAIRGLGSAGGFEFYVQSRGKADTAALGQVITTLNAELAKDPELQGITTFYRPTVPQMRVEVNREQAISLGVPVSDVFDALQATFGVLYVNDFNMAGRAYRVQVQSEGQYRASPDQIGNTFVRSQTTGEMVPIRALITANTSVGPEQVDRMNGFLAAKVLGSGKAGVSSGQAIAAVERVAAKALPAGLHALVERPGLPGEAHRQAVDPRLRACDPDGVPDPLRAVRALAPALGRGARGAVRRAGRGRSRVAARHGERHLLPDRPHRADRPRREERDPDRGIRAAGIALRHERQGGGGAGGAPSLPSDRDDVARVRVRRAAARHRQRRRVGRTAFDGHGSWWAEC
jgi:hypothetical protein